jgi:hypothetical protein
MRFAFIVVALAVLGLAGTPSPAQQAPQATAKAGAKPAPPKFVAAVDPRGGSVGGPVNKGPSINGTGNKPKH